MMSRLTNLWCARNAPANSAGSTLIGFVEIFFPTLPMVLLMLAVYLVDIFLWQSFFFLCGKDVQFFPQYPDAPMNPDYF